MTYYLYIDVIFFINCVMDLLILYILKKLLKLQTTLMKMMIASIVGALWACFVVLFPFLPRILEWIFTYTLISGIMIRIAFSPPNIKSLCTGIAGIYLSAVILGGIMYGLYQYTRTGRYIEHLLNGEIVESIPMLVLILIAAGGGWLGIYLWKTIVTCYKHKKNIYQVTLYYRGKSIRTVGLMDTGNRLYEPTTQKPVSIMTDVTARKLCQTVASVCYIPYQAVGTKSGLLPAIYLDELEIEQDGIKRIVKKPLIAIYSQSLSPYGEYQILLHEELIQI